MFPSPRINLNTLILAVTALALLVSTPVWATEEETPHSNATATYLVSLHDAVNRDQRLSIFNKAVNNSNTMQEALKDGENHYTVIAPLDKAWERDHAQNMAAISSVEGDDAVNPVFDALVVPGRMNIHDIALGETVEIQSVGGNVMKVTRFGSGTMDVVINNHNIRDMQMTDNGYIYVLSELPVTITAPGSNFAWLDNGLF